jgi:hydroxymethylpyrimidine/phosphomethylpyrimidine kinase
VTPPAVLTVAGSDSGGGAGIQADLKTFAAQGVYGTCVVTAVTAQNTRGVAGVFAVPLAAVRAQLSAVLDDIPPAAVKVGMLATEEIAEAVAACAGAGALPNLVLDPVLTSTSGAALGAVAAVRRLLPYAAVVTPNLEEAAALAGGPVRTLADMAAAAERIAGRGPRYVVVTGGGLPGDEAVDAVWTETGVRYLRAPRIDTRNTHGTGCTFSAAIAARLAHGDPVPDAIGTAKSYVARALAGAARWRLGGGDYGPLDHLDFGDGSRHTIGAT